jgi:RNA polymerase sigma-70 factor (ECF subfamily)
VANFSNVAAGAEGLWTGDPGGGFDDHVASLYRPLVRYCARITQVADPEDLAQEALLRAWPSYTEGRDMWPLVVTIARRLAIDEYRRSVRGEVCNQLEAAFRPSATPSPEELVERREEARMARRALAQLSPRYQRMIRMRDIDKRSYTDIAQVEGTSLEVARSTLRRARAALRTAYGRATEGAAAVFGLRGWVARRSSRVQAALGPLTHQGLPTLAGAVAVIAVAAGIAAPAGTSRLTTISPSRSAQAFDAATGTRARRSGAQVLRTSATAGAAGRSPAPSTPRAVKADRMVGPVGIGGEEYRKSMTEDSELKLEFRDPADQVLIGVYANPSKVFTDPTEPIEGDQ